MSRKPKFFIVFCVAVLPLVLLSKEAKSTPPRECAAVREALDEVDLLKLGESRSVLEKRFEQDGGLQFASTSRYVFKSCKFIKIDVEFSGQGIDSRSEQLSTDKIEKISRPYLDYPIKD